MPTNTIEIAWSESSGLEAKLWDKDGNLHDISSVFRQVTGATGVGTVSNKVLLANSNLSTTLEFRPTSKELKYQVPQNVIDQILEAIP